MNPRSPKIFRWLAVLYAAAVTIVSSWPRLRLPNIDAEGLDKLAHFAQYLILAFLVGRGWANDVHSPRQSVLWVAIVVVIIFAALDEYHQGWVPGRDADVIDWLADLCGIIVGFCIGSSLLRRGAESSLPPRERG